MTHISNSCITCRCPAELYLTHTHTHTETGPGRQTRKPADIHTRCLSISVCKTHTHMSRSPSELWVTPNTDPERETICEQGMREEEEEVEEWNTEGWRAKPHVRKGGEKMRESKDGRRHRWRGMDNSAYRKRERVKEGQMKMDR